MDIKQILNTIRDNNPRYKNHNDLDLSYHIFKHPSQKRLSFAGLCLLQKHHKSYQFEYNVKDDLSIKARISLARKDIHPYYLGATKLILFSETDAIMLKLLGGDVEEWLCREFDF